MKKLSIFVAISLLLTHVSFANPKISPSNESNADTSVPSVNMTNEDINNTSPITDLDPLMDDETLMINDHLKVVPKTDHDEDATLHYTIDVTYPQMAGSNLSPEAQQFNQTITHMISEQINRFKNTVKLDAVHMKTLPPELQKNTFTMDYDIDVIKPEADLSIVSVRLSIEGMQGGRPHPFHAHQVLNFDLTHGKTLTLNDLFKKNAAYLPLMAKYSNKTLNKNLQDKWLIADGTKADPKNFKNWNLQEDSILITFDEYQVAPYVDGPQEVEIPLAELKPFFASNAPVMAEFKNTAINHSKKELAKTKFKNTEKMASVKEPPNNNVVSNTVG